MIKKEYTKTRRERHARNNKKTSVTSTCAVQLLDAIKTQIVGSVGARVHASYDKMVVLEIKSNVINGTKISPKRQQAYLLVGARESEASGREQRRDMNFSFGTCRGNIRHHTMKWGSRKIKRTALPSKIHNAKLKKYGTSRSGPEHYPQRSSQDSAEAERQGKNPRGKFTRKSPRVSEKRHASQGHRRKARGLKSGGPE